VGTGLGNYAISYVDGWLTVSAGALAVSWPDPAAISYGTPLGSSQLNASANVAGNFAYAPAGGSVLNAGTNVLTAVFTPNDTVDYTSVTNTVDLVVTPAALSVTALGTNRVYGRANPAFTVVLLGVTNGDTITASASCGATAASAVGSYSIVPGGASGSDLTNYTITYFDGALAVTPAALTITANNRAKPYGQTVSFAGTEFSASGLVNGDTVGSVTLTSAGAAAGATVAGSPYPIVPSAAVGTGLGNYAISYVDGWLTVSANSSLPYLSLFFNPPNLTLSWPTNAGSFDLFCAETLNPSMWTPVTSGISINGTSNTITISAGFGNQYYKLVAP
jgi:hypothetical protein